MSEERATDIEVRCIGHHDQWWVEYVGCTWCGAKV